MSDDKLREAAILKQHDIAPHGYFDEHDTGFRAGVRAALAEVPPNTNADTNQYLLVDGPTEEMVEAAAEIFDEVGSGILTINAVIHKAISAALAAAPNKVPFLESPRCQCGHARMQHVFTYGHCTVCRPDGCPRYDPITAQPVAAPPSDAAQPIAWRWRYIYSKGQPSDWILDQHQMWPVDTKVEIQPLYAHPEDAPGGPSEEAIRLIRCLGDAYSSTLSGPEWDQDELLREVSDFLNRLKPDAPKGPWEASPIDKEEGNWKVYLLGKPKTYVRWRFEGSQSEAEVVRDALNLNRLKGEK